VFLNNTNVVKKNWHLPDIFKLKFNNIIFNNLESLDTRTRQAIESSYTRTLPPDLPGSTPYETIGRI